MQALLICETRLFWMLLNEAGSRGICKLGCNCSEVVITTHLNFASCLVPELLVEMVGVKLVW